MSEKIQKGSDEEEGEVTDSENESDNNTKGDPTTVKPGEEPKADMELESDSEDNKISERMIALSIKFNDDKCKKKLLPEIMAIFGKSNVECDNLYISVYAENNSKEIVKNVISPVGLLRILFHDEEFRNKHLDTVIKVCKSLFGKWRVTNDDSSIDVFEDEIFDFEIDTSTSSRQNMVYYNKKPAENIPKPFSRGVCFNCNGNHNLQSCPEPKNMQKIAENRQIFQSRKPVAKKRYHFQRDQFSTSTPGHLSKELKKALGVASNELPRFIYHMRKFGYPPAWLREAQIEHSGVAVYGSDGAVPEEGDETGEIFDQGEKDRYDIKKLISFPGFNAPVPENIIDEHEIYDCPAITEEMSLKAMKKFLAPNEYKAYKKRKIIQIDEPDSEAAKSLIILTPESQKLITSSRAICVNLGTPIITPTSPFSKLPERDKFGVNISDVINFENLPDSTGIYEKVATSIKKIRELAANDSD